MQQYVPVLMVAIAMLLCAVLYKHFMMQGS